MARSTTVNTSADPKLRDSPSAVSGTRPQSAGAGNLRFATFSVARSSSSPARSRSARLAICWAAAVFVALAIILLAWALRSEEHTSELQSRFALVWRLLLEKNFCNPPHVHAEGMGRMGSAAAVSSPGHGSG